MDINAELFDIFIQETTEHLETIDEALLILEHDSKNKNEIDRLFRSFHTIKSSTALMGYSKVAGLVHKIEDLVHAIREGKRELTESMCSYLLKCRDALGVYIDDTAQGKVPDELIFNDLTSELEHVIVSGNEIESIENAHTHKTVTKQNSSIRWPEREDAAVLRITLQNSEYLTIRGWMVFIEATKVSTLLWSDPHKPSDEDLMNGNFILSDTVITLQIIPNNSIEEVINAIEAVSEVEKIEIIVHQQAPPTESFENVNNLDHPIGTSGYIRFLKEQLQISKMNVSESLRDLNEKDKLWDLYRNLHTLKGISGYLNRNDLFEVLEHMEIILKQALNSQDDKKRENLLVISNYVDILNMSISSTEDDLDAIQIEQHCDFSVLKQAETSNTLPTPDFCTIQEVKSISYQASDFSESYGLESSQVNTEKHLSKVNESEATRGVSSSDLKAQNYIRIPEAKVDNLVDLLGELLILQSLHRQEITSLIEDGLESDSKVINNLMRMERITKDIQSTSMSLRMVSLKSTLQKLQRVARDTSVELSKEVIVQIEGEDTEIDRSVVEKIQDPLLHMVRNSIAHGIEDIETRSHSGKPKQGTVKITAYNKRGNVFIEVEDDGRGMNAERIYKKALEKNLIDPDRNYSEDEIFHFIYLPGFSTEDNVNNISGRGVGMNVVETEIQKIGGRVYIRNNEGKSCAFILKIPINLATINGTVVEISGQKYIIPTTHVKQILKPTDEQFVMLKERKRLIVVRDEVIQLVPLNKLMDLPLEDYMGIVDEGIIVILENDQKFKALPVDKVIGKQEIVLKPLGTEFRSYNYLTGATILGDGKVSLILDVDTIFNQTEEQFEF